MTRLCVLGPSGRMGHQVATLAANDDGIVLMSAADHPGSDLIGTSIAGDVVVGADVAAAIAVAEVYIDFTTPASTRAAAEAAAEAGVAAVIGTTGLDTGELRAIDALAERTGVLTAPNFSLGVNVLLGLAEQAARALGPDYDLEVVEIHHRRKRDAPSGTAIAVAEALANGRGVNLDEHKCYAREGDVGARPDGEIGVASVRGGDVIGEHTAYLIGQRERIEITHRATSREIFAAGALRAAKWLAGKPAGRYTMNDVLGLPGR